MCAHKFSLFSSLLITLPLSFILLTKSARGYWGIPRPLTHPRACALPILFFLDSAIHKQTWDVAIQWVPCGHLQSMWETSLGAFHYDVRGNRSQALGGDSHSSASHSPLHPTVLFSCCACVDAGRNGGGPRVTGARVQWAIAPKTGVMGALIVSAQHWWREPDVLASLSRNLLPQD